MKRAGLLIFALLFAGSVFASGTTANVSWVSPTAYTDGHALPVTDLASYTLTWQAQDAFGGAAGKATTVGTGNFIQVTTLKCGKYNFSLTVATKTTAYSPAAVSAPVAVVYDTGIVCPKPAPMSITITVK